MATATRPARRLTAEARREVILGAAKRVFGISGYHDATTRDIAAAAGVSEALLYQHFPGKRQLFEAVINGAAADLEARLVPATHAGEPFDAAAAAYFDFVEDEAALYRVFFRQALQADPAFQELYRELTGRFLHLCEASLSARLPGDRREFVAHAISGMVTELGLWWVEDRRRSKSEMVIHAARMGRAIYVSEVGDGD
jgi:AcrR family transcriptional regulator